ncbi:CHASE domain-containing protein [Oceanimonas sp. NS1]|nr:CHASE domain-containing protein [Oceanimonas sp. NS1]
MLHLETFAQHTYHQPGFDLLSDPEHRRAMFQARDNGRPVLLGHQHAEGSGYMMLQPVYAPGHATSPRATRFQGWVFTGFSMSELIGGLLENHQFNNAQWLGLRVYSGNTMTPSRLLFQQGSPGRAAGPFVERRFVNFNGHQWLLVFEHLAPALAVGYTRNLLTLAAGLP